MNSNYAAPELLADIPLSMAQATAPVLGAVDRVRYAGFLDAMVHYTRGSGARLRHAAAHAQSAEHQQFFAKLAAEENGHYLLAEADLIGLAGDRPVPPTDSAMAQALVADFDKSWFAAAAAPHWLGALYALENVAAHLVTEVGPQLLRLQLARNESRFVTTHLTADIEHGGAVASLCAAAESAKVLAAAQHAARFWVALHLAALTPGLKDL
jgi:hypothetical protein